MNALDTNKHQLQRMKAEPGFIAALDQSGGSTPKALAAYGIKDGWTNEEGMYALVHQMRTRIITSPSFTLPEQDDVYLDCVKHRAVARVLALSGGYSRQEGDERLHRNHGVIASFSRALLEGLTAQQSDSEFDSLLNAAIQSIFEASEVKIAATN